MRTERSVYIEEETTIGSMGRKSRKVFVLGLSAESVESMMNEERTIVKVVWRPALS